MNNTFKPNAFKIEFNEEEFRVSFAEEGDNSVMINEVNLQFAPDTIMSVIAPLFGAVVEYQEKYGKEIGLKKKTEEAEG